MELTTVKEVARDWLPPILSRWIQRQRASAIRFEGHYATWDEARAGCSGYDGEEILAKVLAATLEVKRGEAVYERDSVLFDRIEYSWPVLAGLMWAAARNAGPLHVLDFGGALGSGYFQNRKFLQALPELRWGVVEQAHFVEAGRKHLQDRQLLFYSSLEECVAELNPKVVLLSGVVQYVPDPYELLERVAETKVDTLIFDRTSFTATRPGDFYRIQKVPARIYEATYPCFFFDEERFRRCLSARDYSLLESFGSLDALDADAHWSGHIFTRTAAEEGCRATR